ncbi:MAG TPA: zf-HC2 domain-containing protein [Bryobacteraceae bacterium]|nr:zf-HC2 domain-containing protein [Bryobacteraceae bacterium]
MTHPSESILALYAGGDLGWLARRRAERHLARCSECRSQVQAFMSVTDGLIQWNELPAIPWSRVAAEMRANIRLGLAAGECVRSEPLAGPLAWMSNVRTLAACASVIAVVTAGTFLQRPSPPSPPVAARTGAVLRATVDGIELNQGGQTLSLLHARTGEVTYSVGAQGSMRAGYVDSDTGNVTINDVYVQ